MSETVIFENPGLIDIRAITTFGVSVKPESDNPIGYFGTGFKYAIAVLLRNNITIRIYAGEVEYNFRSIEEDVRGKKFNMVYMNDTPMGFTTDLGRNWDLWMAYRELHSNCLDEKGTIYEPKHGEEILNDRTYIVVKGEKFHNIFLDRHNIFINTKPIWIEPGVDVHNGNSNRIFYRGVRVGEMEKKALHTYNIKAKMTLTEDRTFRYSWEVKTTLISAIIHSKTPSFMKEVLLAPDGTFEKDLDYSGATPSQEFMDVVKELMDKKAHNLNPSAKRLWRKLNVAKLEPGDSQNDLSIVEKKQLDKSIAFLKQLGYDPTEYKILVTDALDPSVLGQAFTNEGKMVISKRAFMMGTKMVCGTILEEYLHLKHGVADETRSMQNLLIDMIISMGELSTGEPL